MGQYPVSRNSLGKRLLVYLIPLMTESYMLSLKKTEERKCLLLLSRVLTTAMP